MLKTSSTVNEKTNHSYGVVMDGGVEMDKW